MDLFRVDQNAGLLVADDGVVFPTVPQAGGHAQEFVGAGVTLVRRGMAAEAEIGGGLVIGGRHDVPGSPPLADMVQCRKATCQAIGVVVGGRRGSHQAHMARHPGEGRDQREGVQAVPWTVLRPVLQHRVICKEDGVQFAGLGDAGQPAIVFDVGNGADVRFRQPPCGLVLADIAQECVEVELSLIHI